MNCTENRILKGIDAASDYEKVLLSLSENIKFIGKKRPQHFIKIMEQNTGGIAQFSPYGPTADGLERRNPVIAALGDSVTAGRFQWLLSPEEIESNYKKLLVGNLKDAVFETEASDPLKAYPELFRRKLIEHYVYTCVSVINGGIAGDNMKGMYARHERDVISHQPDLVLINGSLNWDDTIGTISEFKNLLEKMVENIKNKTKADIILMTPNAMVGDEKRISILESCVDSIREIADKENVCLADAYAMWKEYKALGYPEKPLLANGLNHPVPAGHEAYARMLMGLIVR